MKNKFKNWWNRPITRGDYTKWCLGSLVASTIFGVVTYKILEHEQKKLYEFENDTEEEIENLNDSEIN